MNCANHSDQAAVAFCRTCGKPLCNQCTRDVRGVIYCESCLAARMEGAAPAGAYTPPAYAPPAYTPPQNPYRTVVDPNLAFRSEEHTSELQSRRDLVCRLLLE